MSADLLAAFGTEDTSQGAKTLESLPGSAKAQLHLEEENTWQPWPKAPHRTVQHEQQELWRPQNEGNDILFDADEDDFGEFEDAERDGQAATTSIPTAKVSIETGTDLLSLDGPIVETQSPTSRLSTTDLQYPQPDPTRKPDQTLTEDDDWGAFEDIPDSVNELQQSIPEKQDVLKVKGVLSTTKSPSSQRPSQSKSAGPAAQPGPDSDGFDDWDDWNNASNTNGDSTQTASSLDKTKQVAISEKRERPTNVPPPAVLLNLVPKVLTGLSSQAGSSNLTEIGLQAVEVYKVSARLIAGRSLRWKRDTVLAQSMRIGAAGRSGGMKLTALDKGESRKEEQEVEETLSTWTRHSMKLNAAMSKAKTQKPPLSLSTNIVVRTATGPDIINATHPCPVCGLRRNERINGIDVNISDTFGEFWIEYWGHKDCQEFWYRYNNLLDQR